MQLSDFNMSTNNTNIFSQLSELENSEVHLNQDGGFFNFICDDTKIEKAVLEAVRLKKYDIVNFFIEKDLIQSYGHQDDNGNTLLHYLALDYDNTKHIIHKLLKRGDVKTFINAQNNNGDTMLILAVMGGHHDLCGELIHRGADKTIKNKQNVNVDSETEFQSSINAKPLSKNKSVFNPIIELLQSNKKPKSSATSDAYTFSAMDRTDASPRMISESMDTEKFMKQLSDKLNDARFLRKHSQNGGGEFMNSDKGECPECNMIGGGCGCGNYDESNTQNEETENLLHTLKNYMNQSGGKKKNKKQVTGKRTISKFIDGEMDANDRGDELRRIIDNQAGEIIEDIIKKIQEIIIKNKADFKKVGAEVAEGSEAVARVYKAALWASVKNDPASGAKSTLDIAVNIKKQLEDLPKIKKVLLDIDYDKWFNILKTNAEEKEKRRQQVQESSTISLSNYTDSGNSSTDESSDDSYTSSEIVRTRDVSETSY